jgi:tRNA pseudouridine55 synthase
VINHGIINIYKEKGYTSHDVVAILRKLTGTKAGHTGTLDPNAEGVLPVCLGKATKLADFIMAADKAYAAEVVLGVTTATDDMTGEILKRGDANVNENGIKMCLAGFMGEQQQIPPMYSAIKINGKKLYDLARKGVEVERKARQIFISGLRILTQEETRIFFGQNLNINENEQRFFIEVHCSKGTYIRSLCADIGEKLGCGAAMGELVRTRSGMFCLDTAVKINVLMEAAQTERLHEYVLPVETVLPYPRITVHEAGVKMAANGNALSLSLVEGLTLDTVPPADKRYWLRAPDSKIIGLFALTPDGGFLRAQVML